MKNALALKKPYRVHMNDKARQIIFDLVCYLYLALYWYTAYEKFVNHAKFEKALGKSELIGDYATSISWLVPFGEAAIGLLLILPVLRRIGLWLAISTMTVFTVYISFMMAMKKMGYIESMTCYCSGFISKMTWPQHLVFNLIYLLIGIAALVLHKKYSNTYK